MNSVAGFTSLMLVDKDDLTTYPLVMNMRGDGGKITIEPQSISDVLGREIETRTKFNAEITSWSAKRPLFYVLDYHAKKGGVAFQALGAARNYNMTDLDGVLQLFGPNYMGLEFEYKFSTKEHNAKITLEFQASKGVTNAILTAMQSNKFLGIRVAGALDIKVLGITKNGSAVVTTETPHGLKDGDWIHLKNVVGMAEVDDMNFRVLVNSETSFTLTGVNSTNYGVFTEGSMYKISAPGEWDPENANTISVGFVKLGDAGAQQFNADEVKDIEGVIKTVTEKSELDGRSVVNAYEVSITYTLKNCSKEKILALRSNPQGAKVQHRINYDNGCYEEAIFEQGRLSLISSHELNDKERTTKLTFKGKVPITLMGYENPGAGSHRYRFVR